MTPSGEAGGDRGLIEWTPRSDSKVLVEQLLSVVHYYRDGGYPAPTARDVFYDLCGRYGYEKSEAFKRKVYRLLSKMRRSGMVAFDEIDDDSSKSVVTRSFRDPSHFWGDVEDRAGTYTKNLTTNQPKRVVVFTEGAGAVNQFYEVAKDYHIPVRSPGGWDSLDFKHQSAVRAVYEYRRTGRQTIILHAGDLDPDGTDIFRVFVEDVHAFVEDFGEEPDIIVFKRVMLLPEQVPEHGKIPFDRARLKKNDHRGRRWPHDFKAELQALGLDRRLEVMREAIEAEVDDAQLKRDRAAGRDEYLEIKQTAAKLAKDASESEEGGRP